MRLAVAEDRTKVSVGFSVRPPLHSLFFTLMSFIAGFAAFFSPASAPAADPAKLVFFGDSLTAGYGLNLEEAYPFLIGQKLDAENTKVTVVNAGSSGDTTADGVRRLNWILKQKPTWVVIALGANDMLRGTAVSETEHNLNELIQNIRAAHAQPLLFGMKATPNLGANYTKTFNAVFAKVSKATHTPLLDFFIAPVAGRTELTQSDGLHPTAEGQKKIADFVWPFLKEQIKNLNKNPPAKTDRKIPLAPPKKPSSP